MIVGITIIPANGDPDDLLAWGRKLPCSGYAEVTRSAQPPRLVRAWHPDMLPLFWPDDQYPEGRLVREGWMRLVYAYGDRVDCAVDLPKSVDELLHPNLSQILLLATEYCGLCINAPASHEPCVGRVVQFIRDPNTQQLVQTPPGG